MKDTRIFASGEVTGMGIVLATSMILVFMLLTFDERMAQIYLLMLVTFYFWYTHDNNITLPIERSTQGRFKSLIYAFGIFVGFLVLSTFLSSSGLSSVFKIFGTTTPVFAGNKVLTFIAWGLLIPIIETALFFGIFYEGLAHYIGKFMRVGEIPIRLSTNIFFLGITTAIAIIFTAYHFQTRGLTDNMGLLITFLFAFISCLAVSAFRQTREAIFFHAFVNSTAVLTNMGMLGGKL